MIEMEHLHDFVIKMMKNDKNVKNDKIMKNDSQMFGMMNKWRRIVTNLTKLKVSTMTPRNDLVVKKN